MRWLPLLTLLLPALASAAEALDAWTLQLAEWRRDTPALIEGTTGPDLLPRLARALGRVRDARALPRLTVLAGAAELEIRREAAMALGYTPGAAEVIRVRLEEETDRGVRRLLWHALGMAGDGADVARIIPALAGADGEAAAVALGRLAIRKQAPVESALSPLLAALNPVQPDRTRAMSFALYRVHQGFPAHAWTAADRAAIAEVWASLADPSARAWLVPLRLAGVTGAERRALVVELTTSDGRLVRQAAIAAVRADDLAGDQWIALADDADPWVRLRARERLGPREPADVLRDRVSLGTATAQDRRDVLAWALHSPDPRERSASAIALLARPSPAEVESLASASDPVVRELAAEHLTHHPDPRGWDVLSAMVDAGGGSSTWLVLLDALGAVPKRFAPPPPVRDRVVAMAAAGPFLVRQQAFRLATGWGAAVPAPPPVDPGPPGLLERVGRSVPTHAEVDTTEGTFILRFEPDVAPLAVESWATLAEADAFDGLRWHRVVPGFVVQTGDPRGDGMGGPDWMIPDEVSGRPYETGTVGMARAGRDTGSSQWFVTLSPQPHLVGDYTRFGQVELGLDVLGRLDTDDTVLDVRVVRWP